MSFDPLFDPGFWFQRVPPPLTPFFERALFAFFGLVLILGAVVRIVGSYKKYDRYVEAIFGRVGNMMVTMGFLGVIVFFFAYEQIPVFGSRYWFLIWGLGLVVWIAWIVYYAVKVIPEQRLRERARKELMKYMPKKKRKNKKRKK